MSTISRRSFIKYGIGAAAALTSTVGIPFIAKSKAAALPELVAGVNSKPGEPSYEALNLVPGILKKKFGIDLNINMHGSMTLGTDWSQMEAVQSGLIDITSNSTPNFASFTKAWMICDLPYAFPDSAGCWKFLQSPLFKKCAAQMEKDMKNRVITIPATGAGGFRILFNRKKTVKTPADAKGLKVRIVRSPVNSALMKAWGANPTPMAWSECYSAMEQGVIDGFDVQPVWIYGGSMFEVGKFVTRIDAIFTFQLQVMNRAKFEKYPKEVQDALMIAFADAAKQAYDMDHAQEEEYLEKLRKKGCEIYTPTAEEKKLWIAPTKSIATDVKGVNKDDWKALQAMYA